MRDNFAIHQLVRQIHAAPQRAAIALTGGGSRALSDLLTMAGASQTILEAVVPYATAALANYLVARPEQFCSRDAARAMAMTAYQRAARLRACEEPPAEWPIVGLALTASLAGNRPKRGPHRVYLAAQTDDCTWSQALEMHKGLRTRDEEESLVADLALNLLAEACGLPDRLGIGLVDGERLEPRRTAALPEWRDLLTGSIARTNARPGIARSTSLPRAVFPGSFHPLHDGHRRMAAMAEQLVGGPVAFELSIENVEKPPLDFEEMSARESQFSSDAQVWFTRAPRMIQKARLFPGATIVCGVDTLARVSDPKFAEGSAAERDRTITEMAAVGCRFLVFGRTTAAGFQTLDSLELPDALRRLCTGVPENVFRADVSSTSLRRANPAKSGVSE